MTPDSEHIGAHVGHDQRTDAPKPVLVPLGRDPVALLDHITERVRESLRQLELNLSNADLSQWRTRTVKDMADRYHESADLRDAAHQILLRRSFVLVLATLESDRIAIALRRVPEDEKEKIANHVCEALRPARNEANSGF